MFKRAKNNRQVNETLAQLIVGKSRRGDGITPPADLERNAPAICPLRATDDESVDTCVSSAPDSFLYVGLDEVK